MENYGWENPQNLNQGRLQPHSPPCSFGGCNFNMCQGLNSHYFHIIGDGHQPNNRGLYTHYKDSVIKGGRSLSIPNKTRLYLDHGTYKKLTQNDFKVRFRIWGVFIKEVTGTGIGICSMLACHLLQPGCFFIFM